MVHRFTERGESTGFPFCYFLHRGAKRIPSSWLSQGPAFSGFSGGRLGMSCFSRRRTGLGERRRAISERMSTEPFSPCWDSVNTCRTPARWSDWGTGSRAQRQGANLLGDPHAANKLALMEKWPVLISWGAWRWELRPVWSLIKDGSWCRRPAGPVLRLCHKLLLAFCFPPGTPVALSSPLPLSPCCSVCSPTGVTLSPSRLQTRTTL